MKRISLENISKLYGSAGGGTARAVDDVSVVIEPGEFFFLLGPSGCGKTTLLRIIAGLTDPTAGRVLLGDRDVTGTPIERRRTAMVFQSYALWPHMTVRQNVEFGPRMQGVARGERRALAEDSLARVRMGEYAGRKPNQLSGGQQQRVALARALAARADCLLLDEPLSNLDARLRLQMRTELRGLVKSSGTTAVYVTHDQKEALSMADRIAVMDVGRVVQVGRPGEVYDHPASRFVADFLGEANFLPGRVSAGAPRRVQTPVGVLPGSDAGDAPPGTAVTCCVRPERVAIAAAAAAAPPAVGDALAEIAATVESSLYLGETRQYVCRLAEGSAWKVFALAGAAGRFEPGDKVVLRFVPGDMALLRD
jgi:iron(III) transport system ATP-binding protein